MARLEQTKRFLLENLEAHPTGIVRVASEALGISRQAVHRQLQGLIHDGFVQPIARGARNRGFALRVDSTRAEVAVHPGLSEDKVWRDTVSPLLEGLPQNVRDICQYGFTEMFNNVVDHSGSLDAVVEVSRSAASVRIEIEDHGVGIFRKIREAQQLDDDRQSILELAKGKLTTDPARHTGEGIFFTSRMFDRFFIHSGLLLFKRVPESPDVLHDSEKAFPGTSIRMEISAFSERESREVFARYVTEQDDYAFTRTLVAVSLLRIAGEGIVSRSQAKRLLARLERFREVVLDFASIDTIGPAFADEVFRVFQNAHPEVRLMPINPSPAVLAMIRRALAPQ